MSDKLDCVIIGAGAAGMIAALRLEARGQSVILLERDSLPQGSTALSAGLIPVAGTKIQERAGIEDSLEIFTKDILKKANHEPNEALVKEIAKEAAETIDWLHETFSFPFSVLDNFTYPGHSRHRMHGLPSRSGRELMDRLRSALEDKKIDILCNQRVLKVEAGFIITTEREKIEAKNVILACNGYGGNSELVAEYIPEMANSLYFGHKGNQGDALLWGEAMGADHAFLSGYQGHGSVAHPHGILMTWALMTEGGLQVNLKGERFHDELKGYSEAAREVLKQDQGLAFAIFDERIASIARQFDDFKSAEKLGALVKAETLGSLAEKLKIPVAALLKSYAGRGSSLKAPFYGVKVTGALFHTQGGLKVYEKAQVLHKNGSIIKGLYAVGGAAAGVSGSKAEGYLSGNGLLTAIGLGSLAGKFAISEA